MSMDGVTICPKCGNHNFKDLGAHNETHKCWWCDEDITKVPEYKSEQEILDLKRDEEIKNAAAQVASPKKFLGNGILQKFFILGAKWSDKHPKKE